tara:strand:+ start:1134 stop:1676 length:543 start_codon:yes stop_codon:yes gene_type:complete
MAAIKLNNVTALSETGGVATFGTSSATLKYPAGHVIQYDSVFSATPSSTDVLIPADGTKPQITEGASMLNLAFTPLVAGSTLEILVNVGLDSNNANNLALCLFNTVIHSTDAVAVSASRTGGGINQNITILYNYTTPSTAAATWQTRYGGSAATIKIGQSNSFTYGSTMQYGMTIKEIMA